jgi:nicotinamidase-related amidase
MRNNPTRRDFLEGLINGSGTVASLPLINGVSQLLASPAEEEKYAVLIIDFQFTEKDEHDPDEYAASRMGYILNYAKEIKNMGEVLKAANKKGIHVVDVNISEGSESTTDPALRRFHNPKNWSYLAKQQYSAFEETSLDKLLTEKGITDLIVMGWQQNCCVMHTIDDAAKLGYRVFTSFDVIQGGVIWDQGRVYEMGGDKLRKYIQETKNITLVDNYKQLPILTESK